MNMATLHITTHSSHSHKNDPPSLTYQDDLLETTAFLKFELAEAWSCLDQARLDCRSLSEENESLKLKIATDRLSAGRKSHRLLFGEMALQIEINEKERKLLLKRQGQLTHELELTRRHMSIQQKAFEENLMCMQVLRDRQDQSKRRLQKKVREKRVSPENLDVDVQYTPRTNTVLFPERNETCMVQDFSAKGSVTEQRGALKTDEKNASSPNSLVPDTTGMNFDKLSEPPPTESDITGKTMPIGAIMTNLESIDHNQEILPKKMRSISKQDNNHSIRKIIVPSLTYASDSNVGTPHMIHRSADASDTKEPILLNQKNKDNRNRSEGVTSIGDSARRHSANGLDQLECMGKELMKPSRPSDPGLICGWDEGRICMNRSTDQFTANDLGMHNGEWVDRIPQKKGNIKDFDTFANNMKDLLGNYQKEDKRPTKLGSA